MKIGIYTRISSDDGTALGVGRQRLDCMEYAKSRKWSVVDVYEDNDTSAYSGAPRPSYSRLVADVEAGRIEGVLCWHPDRLHRQPRELEAFIDLIERTGATVATVTAGEFDLATPEGRLTARITGSVARKESEDKSRRLRRKHQELADTGKPNGGARRFGYTTPDWEIIPEEAAAIREAARVILRGGSCRSIAMAWNAQGIKTPPRKRLPEGSQWITTTVSRMMKGPHLAGLRTHHGEVVGAGTWAPILDVDTHERLVAILSDPSRNTRGTGVIARRHALAPFLRCGRCHLPLCAGKSNQEPAYRCVKNSKPGACGRLAVKAEPLDDLIKALVIRQICMTPAITDVAEVDDNSVLVDELTEVRARIRALEDEHFIEGSFTKARYQQMRAKLDTRAESISSKLATVQRADVLDGLDRNPETLAAAWDVGTVDFKHGLISAVLETVTILAAGKGNRFDPSRVEVELRPA